MVPRNEPSLVGGECGVPATHTASVSIALGRLRFGVLFCCWAVALALAAQLVIWAMVSFTDMRWEKGAADQSVPLIVHAQDEPEESARTSSLVFESPDMTPHVSVDANRRVTKYDSIFATAASLASGAGSIGMFALVPLVGLGVLLAAASATAGVEKAVSAFCWALIIGLLVMPVGGLLGLPWQDGGLWSYATLTGQVDAAEGAGAMNMVFIAKYLLLPAACIVGISLVGMRFSSGVAAGLARKENLTLDPMLEREAGNIKPSSLHGGRAAAAMQQAVGEKPQASHVPPTGNPLPGQPPAAPSIGQPAREQPPKRLI